MAKEPADDAVENNADATCGRLLGGITRKGFIPGRSGNPGGRPKALAALIRSQTKQGKELVDLMLRIARGEPIRLSLAAITGQVVEVEKRPSIRDRMDAVMWLTDRGWGKAKDTIALEDEGTRPHVATLVFLGGDRDRDPLAEPEPKPQRLPPTLPAIAEVPFEMDDIDLPPREGR